MMMMILIEPDELHNSCQHKKGVVEAIDRGVRNDKKRMRNWDLMGWAGTHEFIIESARFLFFRNLRNNNYNE